MSHGFRTAAETEKSAINVSTKAFLSLFCSPGVNNRICSVISLRYGFFPSFLNPTGNRAALFTERWRLKSERRPLRPTHSLCPPLEASDISVLERSNRLMRFGSCGARRPTAIKHNGHEAKPPRGVKVGGRKSKLPFPPHRAWCVIFV